jgi:hypothetical protein
MVAAGSVVSCDSVLPYADACGVAFRVAMDAHFASHPDWLPCPPSAPAKGLDSPPPTTSSKWWSRDIRGLKHTSATFLRCQGFERLAEMCEDFPDRARLGDEGDEPHVAATPRALQRKLLPTCHQFGPGDPGQRGGGIPDIRGQHDGPDAVIAGRRWSLRDGTPSRSPPASPSPA